MVRLAGDMACIDLIGIGTPGAARARIVKDVPPGGCLRLRSHPGT